LSTPGFSLISLAGKRDSGMALTIVWMKGPLVMGTRAFDSLDEATQSAQEELLQMQRQFGATAMKVVDESGNPCFLRAISRNP
jgi:hypothetical protein